MESSSQVKDTERSLDMSFEDEPENTEDFVYNEFLRFNTDRPPLTSTQNKPARQCNVYTSLKNMSPKSPSVLESNQFVNERHITNEDIFRLIMQTEKNKKKSIERLAEEICALKEHIKILKTEVRSLMKENEGGAVSVLPSRPFATEKEFNDFEDSLSADSSKMKSLKENFARLGGDDVQIFLKKNIKKFICDDVAQSYSWKGTSSKRALQGTQFVLALKGACVCQIPNAKEEIIDKHIKRHFQYAKERLCKVNKTL